MRKVWIASCRSWPDLLRRWAAEPPHPWDVQLPRGCQPAQCLSCCWHPEVFCTQVGEGQVGFDLLG